MFILTLVLEHNSRSKTWCNMEWLR